MSPTACKDQTLGCRIMHLKGNCNYEVDTTSYIFRDHQFSNQAIKRPKSGMPHATFLFNISGPVSGFLQWISLYITMADRVNTFMQSNSNIKCERPSIETVRLAPVPSSTKCADGSCLLLGNLKLQKQISHVLHHIHYPYSGYKLRVNNRMWGLVVHLRLI